MPMLYEAVLEISSILELISVTEVTLTVGNLHSGKAAGVYKIQPEMKSHGKC